jgi:hypothetical protein
MIAQVVGGLIGQIGMGRVYAESLSLNNFGRVSNARSFYSSSPALFKNSLQNPQIEPAYGAGSCFQIRSLGVNMSLAMAWYSR